MLQVNQNPGRGNKDSTCNKCSMDQLLLLKNKWSCKHVLQQFSQIFIFHRHPDNQDLETVTIPTQPASQQANNWSGNKNIIYYSKFDLWHTTSSLLITCQCQSTFFPRNYTFILPVFLYWWKKVKTGTPSSKQFISNWQNLYIILTTATLQLLFLQSNAGHLHIKRDWLIDQVSI